MSIKKIPTPEVTITKVIDQNTLSGYDLTNHTYGYYKIIKTGEDTCELTLFNGLVFDCNGYLGDNTFYRLTFVKDANHTIELAIEEEEIIGINLVGSNYDITINCEDEEFYIHKNNVRLFDYVWGEFKIDTTEKFTIRIKEHLFKKVKLCDFKKLPFACDFIDVFNDMLASDTYLNMWESFKDLLMEEGKQNKIINMARMQKRYC